MFGLILLVVIAVAVTVVTSGAALAALSPGVGSIGAGITALATGVTATGAAIGAGTMIAAGAIGGVVGSIASQGFGVATGIQDKFSWKAVAMAGIAGGIGAGLGSVFPGGQLSTLSTIGRGAALGAAGSALSQGIGVAVGLQKKFDFAGVAAAGLAGGVSAGVGRALGAGPLTDMSARNIGANLATSAASAIANAATRSVINGSDFGDNLLAALPDVIGSTLGNMIAEGVADLLTPAQRYTGMGGPIERDTRRSNPQTAAEAEEYALEAIDIILNDDVIYDNDPEIVASHLAALARWGPSDSFGDRAPIIARGLQGLVEKWGGDTETLARALAALGGNREEIGSWIRNIGLEMHDGDFIFEHAQGLVRNYAWINGGPLAGLAADAAYRAERRAWSEIGPVLDTVNGFERLRTDAEQVLIDGRHAWDHVENLELPNGGGHRFEMEGGSQGNWSDELNTSRMHPNSTYVVNGYTYTTDSRGRVISVEGTLGSAVADRNEYRQRQVGRAGNPGDQGGHLIASIFSGPGDRLNMVPMDGNLNMGRWRSMERSWVAAQRAGQTVNVNIQAIYRGNSIRPASFNVIWTTGGQTYRASYRNGR